MKFELNILLFNCKKNVLVLSCTSMNILTPLNKQSMQYCQMLQNIDMPTAPTYCQTLVMRSEAERF